MLWSFLPWPGMIRDSLSSKEEIRINCRKDWKWSFDVDERKKDPREKRSVGREK